MNKPLKALFTAAVFATGTMLGVYYEGPKATGIDSMQLRTEIVRPTLKHLGHWSKSTEDLLVGTAAQESKLGHFIVQVRGNAKSIYQIEPATHQDIWEHYLKYKPELRKKIKALLPPNLTMKQKEQQLVTNLAYATAIALCVYLRAPKPLPTTGHVKDLAIYWKTYYNTYKGAGTVDDFITNYRRLVYE